MFQIVWFCCGVRIAARNVADSLWTLCEHCQSASDRPLLMYDIRTGQIRLELLPGTDADLPNGQVEVRIPVDLEWLAHYVVILVAIGSSDITDPIDQYPDAIGRRADDFAVDELEGNLHRLVHVGQPSQRILLVHGVASVDHEENVIFVSRLLSAEEDTSVDRLPSIQYLLWVRLTLHSASSSSSPLPSRP